MRICKPSKKTGELLKGWLIYSPNVSSGPYEVLSRERSVGGEGHLQHG